MAMRNSRFFFFLLTLYSLNSFSQYGLGTNTPHSSAVLELKSTNKGLLLPRLTLAKIRELNPAPKGLLLYCLDCSPEGLYYSNGVNFIGVSITGVASTGNENKNVIELVDSNLFNTLFPDRSDIKNPSTPTDFYSYDAFNQAINQLSDITIEIHRKEEASSFDGTITDPNTGKIYAKYLSKLVRKKVGEPDVFILSSDDWNASWNTSKPDFVETTIKFSDFLNNNTPTEDKKELAAFFAQISHETSGGIINNVMDKGLVYKEELYCTTGAGVGTEGCKYISLDNGNDVNYPPAVGKTYHGRGPIQLSWNYNYGFFSFIYYGDRNILLNNPEKVANENVLAFASAISFWMLPNGSKPSSHFVINVNNRGFANTINIINGGLECGAANNTVSIQTKVARRINYFKEYALKLGFTISATDTELKCVDLTPY